MRTSSNWLKVKPVLIFLLHQTIGTVGVLVVAPILTGFVFDLLRLFDRTYSLGYLHWLLTGTPYFPVQIALALFLGWSLGIKLRHRSMLWVWVLPLGALCAALVALPTIVSLGLQSRLLHFFAWGCRPENDCFDQLAITLPFYIAASYSIGALVALKLPGANTKDEKAISEAG